MKSYTADGYELTPGMVVWCNNTVFSFPPERRIVGRIEDSGNEFLFDEPDDEGREGCRSLSSWKYLSNAYVCALKQTLAYEQGIGGR